MQLNSIWHLINKSFFKKYFYPSTQNTSLAWINKKGFLHHLSWNHFGALYWLDSSFEHHYLELTGSSLPQNSVTVRPGRTSHNISLHVLFAQGMEAFRILTILSLFTNVFYCVLGDECSDAAKAYNQCTEKYEINLNTFESTPTIYCVTFHFNQ